MEIRPEPAKEQDLAQILQLQKKAFYSQAVLYNDFTLHPLVQTLEGIREEFGQKAIYKVELDGRIVASVRCYIKDDTLYIEKLVVDPDFQDRGVGTMLMTELEKIYSSSVKRYELFTGYKSEKNLHLYNKLGFREIRRETIRGDLTLVFLEKVRERGIM